MPFRLALAQMPHSVLSTVVGLGLCALAGCAPDLGPASNIRPAPDYAAARTFSKAQTDWPAEGWWTAYNDPVLNGLIDRALKTSPDLKAVQARLVQAQGAQETVRAGLFPSLSAKGSIEETGAHVNLPGVSESLKQSFPSAAQPITQLSANVSYELDFFGRNRAAVAAASSDAKAAQFELDEARLELSAAVASAYAKLITAETDEAAAAEATRLRENSRALVADRQRNGLETRAEYSQSNALHESSRVDMIEAAGAVLQAKYALAAVVGVGPDAFLDLRPDTGLKTTPIGLPPHLAADLIGRRPDIAAARLRVEAAAQREKVARADFYPNINLVASGLALSMTPGEFFSHGAELMQVGPAVTLPLFDGGKLAGAARNARGEYEAAVASYDKAVVRALQEVSNAVTVREGVQASIDHAQLALAASQDAYNLATLRYKAGLTTYLMVLTVEDTLLAARRQLDDLKAQAIGADVTLIQALGGGFDETAAAHYSNP
jgi:NodT family efflux transporter outer membrane factor (OMF) lipoprotein